VNIRKYLKGLYPRECPCCDFHGKFVAFGHLPLDNAERSRFVSLERHRLLFIIDRGNGILDRIQSILYFTPKPIVRSYLRSKINIFQ